MSEAAHHASQALVIERPRASDAIGVALRDAYFGDRGLPDDMMRLLARLNGNGGMRSTN